MRQGIAVVVGSLFLILVTCRSENTPNVVKTDTIRNVVGGGESSSNTINSGTNVSVPSGLLNLISKEFDKNSQTKLINRKKRNS